MLMLLSFLRRQVHRLHAQTCVSMHRLHIALVLLIVSTSHTDGARVMNCTFSKYNSLFPSQDDCGFTQSTVDDFDWSFANFLTLTPSTGPKSDHSGGMFGHFAFIESSFKRNGTYARLDSPAFTKTSGEVGGCVQLYYHMYGVDIGTLNISVYDTVSGLVANFQRTGAQGDQWLRADINLDLPSPAQDIQLVIEAFTRGSRLADNKGDIAIDDITISTDGQCSQLSDTTPATQPTSAGTTTGSTPPHSTGTTAPTNWGCDFEGMNTYCGMVRRSYGVGFSVATRSLSTSTGPRTDHTTGSGHFLWMQGLGARENSTAEAETPLFDQSYNCLTFWYHMYGDGVGQLSISADVNSLNQFLWSQTGNQGNAWNKARVRVPPGAVKLIITATRGRTSNSDIAVDDLALSSTDCDGMTVPTTPPTTPAPPTSATVQPIIALACNFDRDTCNLYQDSSDDFDWRRRTGPSFTSGTGPTADHTQGDFTGYYMYIPSNYKPTGQKARLQSGLINVTPDQSACLRFSYHMWGSQMGTLNVRVKNADGSILKEFTKSGNQGTAWMQKSMDISYTSSQVFIEFEGTVEHTGGSYARVKGEMAIDDVILTAWSSCSDLNWDRVSSVKTIPTTTMAPTTAGPTTTGPSTRPTTPTTTFTTIPATTATTTPPAELVCNFDNGLCQFTQSGADDFNWSRFSTKLTSRETGPSRDHTRGDVSGYYMIISASYKRDGAKATLISPAYNKLSDNGCLTFWYHMWGADMGTLNVTMNKGGRVFNIYAISGNQGNQWSRFSIDLDLSGSDSFQISFTGVVSHGNGDFATVLGDIAIDDVTVNRFTSCSASVTPSTPLTSTTRVPPTTTSTLATTSIPTATVTANPSQVMNCTFSLFLFGYIVGDYQYCGFLQSLSDDFQWSLASSATRTAGTGPSFDHTGYPGGHYAFIESSYQSDNSFARLTSPSFLKPQGETGGCVQLYYHMYGRDIGTLSVSVYRMGQVAPVASFQRTGEQGNQWLRASINLSLPGDAAELQLIIDATVKKSTSGDTRGDIAIDDVIITTSGSCDQSSDTPGPLQSSTTSALVSSAPTNWGCDFEGMNTYCGMVRHSYGVGFSVATRSLSTSTGPRTDHTTGSGHFLWMQGLGARENSTAEAETPLFDQSYNCLTFWYHMYGDGVGQLKVAVVVGDGQEQVAWSMTGPQGNQWNMAHVRLPPGTYMLVFIATRGSTSNSDIAIDDIQLSTTDCDGMTVVPYSTTPPTSPGPTAAPPALAIACNFDSDVCSFYQDTTDDFNWRRLNGGTFTSGTGPSFDHTHGDFTGYYMYIPSNYKPTGQKARLQSGLINVTPDQSACLRFSYHMWGSQMGTLNVRVKNADGSILKEFTKSGNQGTAWMQNSMDISYTSSQVFIEFEGTVEHSGGSYARVEGEMAIDDVILTKQTSCSDFDMIRVGSDVTVASTTLSSPVSSTPASKPTTPSTPRPPTTTPWTTPTTTPPVIRMCNFDDSLCGFEQSANDDFDWLRHNAKLTSANTGPSADHTSGTPLAGSFMVIDASYKRSGTKATLLSPLYTPLSASCCLTFWYHMWGADIGTLNVTMKTGSTERIIYTNNGNQGNQWKSTSISLNGLSSSFQIVFSAVVLHGNGDYKEVLGDIAIDDVSINTQYGCGQQSPSPQPSQSPSSQSSQSPSPPPSQSPSSLSPSQQPSLSPTTTFGSPVNASSGNKEPITGAKNNNGAVIAAVVVCIVVVILTAAVIGVVLMRKRQLWLFAPNSKMSVMFARSTSESAELYNGHDFNAPEPSLVINGGNGIHMSKETTDA